MAPSWRASASIPDSYREYDIGDGTVTLDVQDAPFGQVVADRIQPRTRVNIVVAPEAQEQQVTLQVLNLYWVQTLDALVAAIDGVMIREGANLIRIERPLPVTFEFTDEDVRSVITAIAGFASANVILSQEVQGTITLNLKEAPWRAALEQVVRTAGYALVQEDYDILRVVPINQLELETDYYRFRYLRPPVPYKGIITNQGSGSSGGSGGGGGGGSGPAGHRPAATSTCRRTTRPRSKRTSPSSRRCVRSCRPRAVTCVTWPPRTPSSTRVRGRRSRR